jgi:ADP-dependent phosphofructokinase/glucokinase
LWEVPVSWFGCAASAYRNAASSRPYLYYSKQVIPKALVEPIAGVGAGDRSSISAFETYFGFSML